MIAKKWQTPQLISVALLVLTAVIVITPLCGLLFQCHCDWPWSGLYQRCNIFQASAIHQCPWCKSTLAGLVSTGTAFFSAVWVTRSIQPAPVTNRLKNIAARYCSACAVFIWVAVLCGIVAARLQHYPVDLFG